MNAELYMEVIDLYTRYAHIVDSTEWQHWPDLFLDEGTYHLQPRENFDAGLPLCLLALESKAMLRDRVYGVKETMYHDPYYQRHVVGTPRIVSETNGEIRSEANYIVFRTKREGLTEVFNAGTYRDTIVRTEEGLKFRSRLCLYDSELVPNSIIYPI